MLVRMLSGGFNETHNLEKGRVEVLAIDEVYDFGIYVPSKFFAAQKEFKKNLNAEEAART